jgi:glutaredoxin
LLAAKNQVIVYSKPDCCLCEEVKDRLQRLQQAHSFEWREINILDDPAAFARFKEDIPVVFVNGRVAFRYHLDEEKLLNLLL